MAQKKEFDLREVERLAAQFEKQPDIYRALGVPAIAPYLKSNEEFRDAYNRGRVKGGFKLYQPRGEQASESAAPEIELDEVTTRVLEFLRDEPGLTIQEIIKETDRPRLEVSNAIRTLSRHELILSSGDKYFAKEVKAKRAAPGEETRAGESGDVSADSKHGPGRRCGQGCPRTAGRDACAPGQRNFRKYFFLQWPHAIGVDAGECAG